MHGKRVPNQETTRLGEVFSKGILLFVVSLILANIYLFVRSKGFQKGVDYSGSKGEEQNFSTKNDSAWEIYKDELYGYSISYPPTLEPRTIESPSYESFIIFFIPEGETGSGFGISVRENSLVEEVELIKKEIGVNVEARLVSEKEITKDAYLGKRLEYEPETTEGKEPRTIIILNNGKYSYTISAHPSQIDKILDNFDLID